MMTCHNGPARRIQGPRLLAALLVCLALGACKTGAARRAFNDGGFMYGMIYDYDNIPLGGTEIYINGKRIIASDIQGRFILEFRKPGDYLVLAVKPGYEPIEQSFSYDPMNVLYLKMINASQLARLAEETLDRGEGGLAEAAALLDRALALEASRPDLRYLKAVVLYLEGRLPQAAALLEELAARDMNAAGGALKALLSRCRP